MHKIQFIKILRVFIDLSLKEANGIAAIVWECYSGPESIWAACTIPDERLVDAFKLGNSIAMVVQRIR